MAEHVINTKSKVLCLRPMNKEEKLSQHMIKTKSKILCLRSIIKQPASLPVSSLHLSCFQPASLPVSIFPSLLFLIALSSSLWAT